MSAPTVDTVPFSRLLCDPQATPEVVVEDFGGARVLRALGLVERPAEPEFVDSVDRKLTESYEAWCLRFFGTTS